LGKKIHSSISSPGKYTYGIIGGSRGSGSPLLKLKKKNKKKKRSKNKIIIKKINLKKNPPLKFLDPPL